MEPTGNARVSPARTGGGSRNRNRVSRRDFLGRTSAAMASAALAAPLAIAQTPQAPFRIVLIGTGGRLNALLTTILAQPNVEIVACADILPMNLNRTLDRVEQATGKRPEGLTGEKDYLKLLRRDDVQGAVSACPCDLHAPIYLEALRQNKHMYGEKPLCLTRAECRELEAAQKESKAFLQIGFQRRVSVRYMEGIRRIREGEIGVPMEGHAAWNNTGGPLGVGRWLNYRERSGDWMLEQACHTWDVLFWVAGRLPLRAYGVGRGDVFKDVAPDRTVTDYYIATLEYPDGLLINYNHTWSAPRNDNGAFGGVFERIAGLKGGIDLSAGRISFTDADRPPELIEPREPNHTTVSVEHFFECVREGKPPLSGVENGVAATLTGLLVRKAVYEHRRVEMEEILQG